MKIAIIGGELNPYNYQELSKKMNQLMEDSGCYLFYILCGVRSMSVTPPVTLGYKWAQDNGAPVQWMIEPTPADIMKEADYIIFFFDGNVEVKKMMMKYKMMGKHGSVIKVE